MAKRALFGVLGVVASMIFMMSLHMVSTLVYPLPEGIDFMSQEPEKQARLNEWFGTLPTGAFLLATACHATSICHNGVGLKSSHETGTGKNNGFQ
jgi:hypothetical protein